MYHRQQNNLYHQRWQILRKEFLALSRFMLYYPFLPQIEDFPSIKGCENRSDCDQKLQEIIVFAKTATFGVKGILQP